MDLLNFNFWLYVSFGVLTLLFTYLLTVGRNISKNIRGKHVLVTGGSSGIGLGISVACAKKGASVTVVARNVQLLGNIHFSSAI